MKNKKTMKKIGALVLAIGLLAATGIGAYLTSTDVKTDTYTIGSVEITNNFVATNTENMVALDVISYDTANISNTGISDAFVFMTVDIPVASVYTHSADGTGINGPEIQELFMMYGKSAEWTQIGESIPVYDKNYDVVAQRYVFAYGSADVLIELPSGETTSDVFTALQLINIADINVNGQSVATNLENTGDLEVKLSAYGIQSRGLGDDTSAEAVWEIICSAFNLT